MPLSRRQQAYLNRAAENMPDEISDNITEEEKVFAEEKAKLLTMLKYLESPRGKRKFTEHKREKVKRNLIKILRSGVLDETNEVVNEEATEKAERYWEKKIKYALEEGEIEPAETDDFIEKMRKKTGNRQFG